MLLALALEGPWLHPGSNIPFAQKEEETLPLPSCSHHNQPDTEAAQVTFLVKWLTSSTF